MSVASAGGTNLLAACLEMGAIIDYLCGKLTTACIIDTDVKLHFISEFIMYKAVSILLNIGMCLINLKKWF